MITVIFVKNKNNNWGWLQNTLQTLFFLNTTNIKMAQQQDCSDVDDQYDQMSSTEEEEEDLCSLCE